MITRINIYNRLWILLGIIWIISAVECYKFIDKKPTVNIIPGLNLIFEDKIIKIKFNIKELFPDKSIQSRDNNNDAVSSKKPNILQRFGAMLVMVPITMQILSIPGALASIKMSLLKSFFVGKLALILMLYNLIQSLRLNRELFVLHQESPQYYNHYYAPLPDEEEDNGWFG